MKFPFIKRRQYFPKSIKKSKVDFFFFFTKSDIKNISQVDTSSFALKTNLASPKTEVNKLDIDKLVLVPADLSKKSSKKL